jgi:hypothetical protein
MHKVLRNAKEIANKYNILKIFLEVQIRLAFASGIHPKKTPGG